nr:hypothetical protein [Tanacetum cinerariifolium]
QVAVWAGVVDQVIVMAVTVQLDGAEDFSPGRVFIGVAVVHKARFEGRRGWVVAGEKRRVDVHALEGARHAQTNHRMVVPFM